MSPRANAAPPGRRPRAYTLIEMLVVITLIATLLGLGSVLLQGLIRAEHAGRRALDDQAAVARLARQFRRDVHAALGARTEPAGSENPEALVLDLPGGGRIAYRSRAGALIVTRPAAGDDGGADAEDAADEASPREESFRFPRLGAPRLAVRDEDGRRIAVLALAGGGAASAQSVEVTAVVGRDHRFESGGGKP